MNQHDWSRLNHLQVGRYAEYFAKMEFTLRGFDVYRLGGRANPASDGRLENRPTELRDSRR